MMRQKIKGLLFGAEEDKRGPHRKKAGRKRERQTFRDQGGGNGRGGEHYA